MVWEGRVYGLIDSLKSIFQCSSFFGRKSGCHMGNVQHTWYQQASPKPKRGCWDFRNAEHNSGFVSISIAVPECLFIGQVGFVFPVRGWNTHGMALQYFCWLGEHYLSVLWWRSVMWLWISWYYTNVINCYGREGCQSWLWRNFLIPTHSPHHFFTKISTSREEEKEIYWKARDRVVNAVTQRWCAFWPKLVLHGCTLFCCNAPYMGQ